MRETINFNEAVEKSLRYASSLGVSDTEQFKPKSGIPTTEWFRYTLFVPIIIFVALATAALFALDR